MRSSTGNNCSQSQTRYKLTLLNALHGILTREHRCEKYAKLVGEHPVAETIPFCAIVSHRLWLIYQHGGDILTRWENF